MSRVETRADGPQAAQQGRPREGGWGSAPHIASHVPWTWHQSLAAAEPGVLYRVRRVLFGTVRQRCREIGLVEGAYVTVEKRRRNSLALRIAPPRRARQGDAPGEPATLEREYAWFVEVRRA